MTPGETRPPHKRRQRSPGRPAQPPREPRDGFLAVGTVLRPHGLKGEVRILSEAPDTPNLQAGATVHIDEQPYAILHSRPDKEAWVVALRGVPTRDAAEALRGHMVEVSEEDAVPLEEGAYYLHQLVGLRVITETGEDIGAIVEVMQPGANDVYVVDGSERGEILVPAIADVIDSVDIEAGVMRITTLPGLLDESG